MKAKKKKKGRERWVTERTIKAPKPFKVDWNDHSFALDGVGYILGVHRNAKYRILIQHLVD